jgi:hypothetical protein
MKKRMLALALLLALVVPFAAVAEETYYQPGNVLPSIGVGASWWSYGFTVSVYPGVEFMLAKVKIAEVVPLDFGVAVKGLFGFSTGAYSGYMHLGAGVFGTVHWGLRGMDWDLDFLDPVDLWWGIGLAVVGHLPAGWWTGSLFNFATAGGVNWFLNDRLAIMFGGSYWGYGGGYIGLQYKLGKGEKLIKKEG